MKRKSITIDITPLFFEYQGISRMIRALCDHMISSDTNYDFQLYSRCFKWKKKDLNYNAKQIHFPFPRAAEPVMKRLGLVEIFAKSDLYHAADHYLPLKDPSKCVCTIHDLIFLMQPQTKWESHKYFSEVVPAFVKKCAHIITPSEATKMKLIEFFQIAPEKITVIGWGINEKAFYPAQNVEQVKREVLQEIGLKNPFYFALGTNIERKNLTFLLRAYLQLLPQHPKNDLVLVGPITNEQQFLLQEHKFPKKVHFIPHVNDRLLRELYQSATALIYPSKLEGFGCPILEAFACRCPVIASSTSSLPEVGGELAHYIDPEDASSLIQALELIENHPGKIKPTESQFKQQLQKFTWDICREKHLDVYKQLIGA